MEKEFKNIDPDSIDDPAIRAAVQELWTAGELPRLAATARGLLGGRDVLGRSAVFDVYSYRCTTEGTWLAEAFSGLLPSLLAAARELLRDLWSADHPLRLHAQRDRLVASAMHVVWRAVEMEDAPRVLHALRSERNWRILWPAISAAMLMRGNDASFDRDVAPLLADLAERKELSTVLRREAIEALGESPSPEDLRLLEGLLQRLPVPEAASCALILLDAGGDHARLVGEVAKRWPPCDEYPVPLVLERLAR